MTPPKRTPASYAKHPPLFGQPALSGWVAVEGRKEVAAMRAARLQHEVALTVRAYLARRGLHQYDIKDELGNGWGDGKVSRLFSGAATMSLADMFTLINMCGLSFVQFASSLVGDGLTEDARKAVIADYLQEQLWSVQGEIARTSPTRPST